MYNSHLNLRLDQSQLHFVLQICGICCIVFIRELKVFLFSKFLQVWAVFEYENALKLMKFSVVRVIWEVLSSPWTQNLLIPSEKLKNN